MGREGWREFNRTVAQENCIGDGRKSESKTPALQKKPSTAKRRKLLGLPERGRRDDAQQRNGDTVGDPRSERAAALPVWGGEPADGCETVCAALLGDGISEAGAGEDAEGASGIPARICGRGGQDQPVAV